MIRKVDLFRIVPAGVYNGLIWSVSGVPNVHIGNLDKTAHILEYGAFGFLLAFGLGLSKDNFNEKAKYCMILGVLSGAIDEFHQHFVPGRTMDIVDLCSDVTGIALGILALLVMLKLLGYFRKRFSFSLTR